MFQKQASVSPVPVSMFRIPWAYENQQLWLSDQEKKTKLNVLKVNFLKIVVSGGSAEL